MIRIIVLILFIGACVKMFANISENSNSSSKIKERQKIVQEINKKQLDDKNKMADNNAIKSGKKKVDEE